MGTVTPRPARRYRVASDSSPAQAPVRLVFHNEKALKGSGLAPRAVEW